MDQPDNTGSIVVSPEDLAELKVVQGAYNELLIGLATFERQSHVQREQFHSKIENYERQMALTFGRMQQKYGIPQNARVNLETGAIE